jgi:type I restriction enzyme S subunit
LGQYDYSKERFVSREFFGAMSHGHVKNRDVLLYKDGAHIGKKSMFGDGFPHEECCINEHVFILRTNDRCTQAYLFFWLDQPDMTQAIRNLNANAAQPGLNQPGVKGLPVLVPPKPLLEEFDKHANPILSEIFNLAKKNSLLRRTRDLLLPKLISGEVPLNV